MAMMVDRPPGTDPQDSGPESARTESSSGAADSELARLLPAAPMDRRREPDCNRSVRCAHDVGGPAAQNRAPVPAMVAAPASLPTSVSITATEFKFSPASIQVPVGQKVSLTFQNIGASSTT
jgi:hypothetical protein